MNRKIITIFVLVMIGIIYLITSKYFDARKIQVYNRAYHQSNINGKLEYCKIEDDLVYLKLENEPNEYAFLPKTNDLDETSTFCDIAKKGDFIKKAAGSDTLRLIKSYKVYLFTPK